ncbi:thiopurine S-methyltransferase [Ancylobacter sp. A5.8]|uniref:thiopurine S-methyltransferase n=1 Tax=Ancylobacter gelatini TaxID=2919920 RepID=UPI001F4DD93B|nr:thiopurine S-methyltransferase [Ancylobacter gelatini]MCJ8141949.1 thiopurine S-methyltransferase [Ancylobacter gelatini]
MEHEFWHRKWSDNDIGFHSAAPHPLLLRHLAALGLHPGARVFLPLCGKSLDIHWLLQQGYRVAGAELSRLAVEQLFAELNLTPAITYEGTLERFEAEAITVFAGNIFDLDRDALGPVDAVYDRAALVALPEAMRGEYTAHLAALTHHARQLLISFDYDPALMAGPPFSVPEHEVRRHYGGAYHVSRLERVALKGGLKGHPAHEDAWLLEPR